ncbi:hypothetical protein [Streptomyces sp. BK340]|uniref:hypothetical protein n=1 Tax=Streptomyces sp. BK340 TaxID=2572903 RepID=UPI00119E8492|nr:hypothetical protein [Streptomyces sp. BK340]TVZ90492.1 hypothetical protein FB157_111150 [Streptomyces sp. BK340]
MTTGAGLRRQAHRRLGTALIALGAAGTVSVVVMFAWAAIVASASVITGVAVAERASVYTITTAELLLGIAVFTAIRRRARRRTDSALAERSEHHRMRVVVFGGSGLIGDGFLQESLRAPDVTEVITIGRTPLNLTHPKRRLHSLDDG